MSLVRVEFFTTSQTIGPADGSTLLRALEQHVPSWTPKRYGWSEPLRHIYDPGRNDEFWNQPYGEVHFRNAKRSASGQVHARVGPWDILAKVELYGLVDQAELDGGIGAFLAECGRSISLAYGMAHIFSDAEDEQYYRSWFEVPEDRNVKRARQGPFPYFLRDLYWGNLFGPPYTGLFGADRLRTAPAAAVTELRDGCFYLQLTDSIRDLLDIPARQRYGEIRDAVKEHLGAECFYQREPTAPYRAPAWKTAAEEGLWEPREYGSLTGELRALVARAGKRPL